jgi:hypothetical protein
MRFSPAPSHKKALDRTFIFILNYPINRGDVNKQEEGADLHFYKKDLDRPA